MLAKLNRVHTPRDFQRAMRKGRKAGSKNFVIYVTRNELEVTRFGYVVSKIVGNSVVRHTLSRKLREVSREALVTLPTGFDVVVRALAGSELLTSEEIRKQLAPTVERIIKKL